jgi:hypothetical protein
MNYEPPLIPSPPLTLVCGTQNKLLSPSPRSVTHRTKLLPHLGLWHTERSHLGLWHTERNCWSVAYRTKLLLLVSMMGTFRNMNEGA